MKTMFSPQDRIEITEAITDLENAVSRIGLIGVIDDNGEPRKYFDDSTRHRFMQAHATIAQTIKMMETELKNDSDMASTPVLSNGKDEKEPIHA